ncbi:hypothetical protein EMCRGX_G010223 [Ephydatia muelleri]
MVNSINTVPQLEQQVSIQGQDFIFEVDTGAADNFWSREFWVKLGKPSLKLPTYLYEVANGQLLHTLGTFEAVTSLQGGDPKDETLTFTVTNSPRLNLLGRDAIVKLGVNVQALLGARVPSKDRQGDHRSVKPIFKNLKPDVALQKAYQGLCEEFPDLFKQELGCLEDFELVKGDAAPIFCKPRPVSFAIQDDLNQAYDAWIAKGVWKPIQFNGYGTPVVPIRQKSAPGQPAKIRVCGDYSVTVNSQLETHRYPMPLPDDLMRKLSGGYGFSKVDLADAYNQINSAPGYFQEVMDKLTADLQGVIVYLDDILVSGATASNHLQNLRALFLRLQEKGLKCRLEKCSFAQSSVEYLRVLGFMISNQVYGGSVQFYNKFLPNLATTTEPLYWLTKKEIQWKWGAEEQATFQALKNMLCADTVLAHFDPSLPVGVSCDASEVGLGAVLFHRYGDGTDHGNADVLSRLPVGPDITFDGEESEADVDMVCTIRVISLQLNPTDPGVLAKESAKDPVIANVMRYSREEWPTKATSDDQAQDYSVELFRKLSVSLSTLHGCLLHGTRVVVPPSLQPQVLELLHLGHFGIQRMKQLARTAVYWPRIDTDIANQCHRCQTCVEHQTKPAKPANHPWMLPEKPWSRIHVDHAINFLGTNWLVYPTTQLQMEQAERLVQTFKQALVKSTLPPKTALQEFLMQYRRTPLAVGYSPSEFLNSRQIRSKMDILLPSPAHICQGRQARKATKSQAEEINDQKATVHHIFKVGTPCYALYCGPRRDKDPRWVPAVVSKVFGTRSVNVRVFPKGGTRRRHIEQLRPRYGAHEDADPEVDLDTAQSEEGAKAATPELQFPVRPYDLPKKSTRNPRLPNGTEYGPGNPRRSTRQRK